MKEQAELADRGYTLTSAEVNERLPNNSTVSWIVLLISDSLQSPFTYRWSKRLNLLNGFLFALLISFIATLGCSFC